MYLSRNHSKFGTSFPKENNWNNIFTGASILWNFSGSRPVQKSSAERRVVQVRQQEISTVQLDACWMAARDSHWGAKSVNITPNSLGCMVIVTYCSYFNLPF